MADKIQTLLVSLEARINQYEATMRKAMQQTDKSARQIENRFAKLNTGVASSFNALGNTAARVFALLGASMGAGAIADMTSAWTDLNSRIVNAVGSAEKGAAVLDQLSTMARRTYSSLNQTAEGFLNNNQALTALGYSTQQQLDLMETLNNALVVGAVRGQRAQSVQDAWSKAMASGSLRGENLNTVIQSGGRLSKALADSMGISVNELRKMGEQGKITTDVMYGVTSQMETLRDEAANMPATISDGFVLLRDAVWKFVGEADSAAGSSSALAEAIIAIADAIDRMPEQGWFDKLFKGEAEAIVRGYENTRKEIEAIGRAIEWLQTVKTDDFFRSLFDTNAPLQFQSAAEQALSAVEDSWRRVANEAYAATSGELQSEIANIISGINEETLAADEAAKKLAELAIAHPEAEPFISIMQAWTDSLYAVRDGALAAAQGLSTVGEMPSWRQFQKVFGPDLSKDGAPGGPIRPPSSGGGGKSPGEKYGESLADFERRIEMLREETALMSTLNPLVNDYGYAKERLKAIQELENAAKRAGIELDAGQRDRIYELADAYASATAAAAQLAEAQGKAKAAADELANAGRQALDAIVDGFLEGKDAGEMLNNVMKDLLKNLIKMGLNAIGGGLFGGGGGLLGGLFGGLGFASGTANTGGMRGQPRGVVHGQEAVIPLPNGGRVPVDIRAPEAPRNNSGPQELYVHVVSDDEKLSAYVTDRAGNVVRGAAPTIVKASAAAAPGATAEKQLRYG